MIGTIDSGVQIITNGLLLWLDAAQKRSYSGSGTTWNDLSGSGLSGNIGSQTWNNSYGGRINFATNQTFDIPSDTPIDNISTGVSVSVVTDAPSSSTMGYNVVISRTSSNNWNDGFGFYYGSSTMNWWVNDWQGRATYTIGGGGNQTTPIIYTGTYSTTDNLKLYVNGNLHQTKTQSGNISMPIGNNLSIGSGPINNYVWGSNSGLYIVYIYNRALSSTEVLQNYNAVKSRFGL